MISLVCEIMLMMLESCHPPFDSTQFVHQKGKWYAWNQSNPPIKMTYKQIGKEYAKRMWIRW